MSVIRMDERRPKPDAPRELTKAAQELWRDIVNQRPAGFYSAGDLPLLREFCHTSAVLLPQLNAIAMQEFDPAVLRERDRAIRQMASLSGKLRICVSSRTRPDAASMRDSVQDGRPKPWEF